MAIQGINPLNDIAAASVRAAGKTEESVSFKNLLMDALYNVNALEQESAKLTEDFIAGRTDSIHSVLIAAEKATISLQFITEVRNKVLEAYQEIMRMQI